jgi:uncharacterized protein YegJ (DUF2314 family)
MTPKNKAIELVEKFMPFSMSVVYSELDGLFIYNEPNEIKNAKQCASIAVDEILDAKPRKGYLINGGWVTDEMFWEEVKQEIKTL